MHRKTIILVTICAFLNVGDALTLDALPEMVFDVAKIILKARKIVGNYAVEGVPYPLFEKTEREMFKRFDLVNNNLEYLSRRTEGDKHFFISAFLF